MPQGIKVRASNGDKLIATYATPEAANGAQIELTKNYPDAEFIVEAVAPDAPVETSSFNIPGKEHSEPVTHTHAHTHATTHVADKGKKK